MKKIILTTILALSMVTSSFALGFSIGAKGMMGTNLGTSFNSFTAEAAETFQKAKEAENDLQFLYAGGVYVDFSLFGPLGVQVGANVSKNALEISVGEVALDSYSEILLDVPVMLWSDFKLGPIGLGLGFGPNLSYTLDASYACAGKEFNKDDFALNKAVIGLTAGANAKIYFNDHMAFVAGASYILDLQKKELTLATAKKAASEVGLEADDLLEFKRSVVFANLGLELRLF